MRIKKHKMPTSHFLREALWTVTLVVLTASANSAISQALSLTPAAVSLN